MSRPNYPQDVSGKLLNKVVNNSHPTVSKSTSVSDRNLEVIKQALSPLKELLTPERVEELASDGISSVVICHLHKCASGYIDNDPILRAAFDKGRGGIAQKIRTSLIEDALVGNSLPAKIHLDKILSKEDATRVEVTVKTNPAEEVPIEVLLEYDVREDDED